MAGSVNKVILIGNVGQDPEIRSMQSGDRVCNLSIATSESWKAKDGERQEKTQWHKVVVFNQNIVGVVEKYVKKGAKLYLEGQLETRTWEKDGIKQYSTEVLIKPFNGVLTMLDSGKGDNDQEQYEHKSRMAEPEPRAKDEFEDEIPF